MDLQTIELQPLDFRAEVGAINVDDRTVDLTWTTGADVERFDWMTGTRYIERLSTEPKHVDMSRLNSGTAPLLDTHSAWTVANVIGVVESARLERGIGESRVRFAKAEDDPAADRVFRKVKDRIVRNNSVGYKVLKYEVVGEKNGVQIRLATRWFPYEISMVPMGADAGARTRSTQPGTTNYCLLVRPDSDSDRLRRLLLAKARMA